MNAISLQLRPLFKDTAQNRYRMVGLAMLIVAGGLLFARILASLFSMALSSELDPVTHSTWVSVFFTLIAQIGICFAAVFLTFKLGLKQKNKRVLEFSNVKKTRWFNLALMIPLGILGIFVTIGVSSVWSILLYALGYNSRGGGAGLPAEFSIGIFILQLFLIAVLPAVCEEFAMRGGLFSVFKDSFKGPKFYVFMGLAFGLFHQNITQFLYTALFGVALAFVVVKTKSIWPAIILHFINNAISVYLSHAAYYNWAFMGNFFSFLADGLRYDFAMVLLVYGAICAAFGGILVLLHYLNSTKRLEKKKQVILDSGFDHTNNRVVLVGEFDESKVKELGLEKEVLGVDSIKESSEPKYKPTLADNAFYIGAIVTTGLFTLFSFIWGVIV